MLASTCEMEDAEDLNSNNIDVQVHLAEDSLRLGAGSGYYPSEKFYTLLRSVRLCLKEDSGLENYCIERMTQLII